MAGLNLKDMCKSFGAVQVVKDVNLDVKHGEFVVFVGPSGCGKSTLLRMIAGLEEITAGELWISDVLCNEVEPRDRGIAMVFQSYALYPHMTVYNNMGFGLKLAKTPKAERDRKVRDAARILQMEDLLKRKPAQLSGGQRQRVAIGRAIVRQPEIFLFDEPLSNLDAALRVDMRMELSKLHDELGATMIYVTHDQVEAMTLADKIVVLDDGMVQQIGTPIELFKNPVNLFVAGFIGSPKMNFTSVVIDSVDENSITVSGKDLERVSIKAVTTDLAVGQQLTLGIRPGDLKQDLTAAISGSVAIVERLGSETIINLTLKSGASWLVVFDGDQQLEQGQSISLGLSEGSALFFDDKGMAVGR